jgi:hypothetical protein
MAKKTPQSQSNDAAPTSPASPRAARRSPAGHAPSDTFAARTEPSASGPSDVGAPDTGSSALGSEPTEEQIRMRAYHRYLQRGGGHGMDFEDWLEAERELKNRT